MRRLIWRRIFGMVPTLFGITLVTFALVKLAPGDPVTLELEGGMRAGSVSHRVVDDFRHAFFLDLPLLINLEPVDVRRRVDRLVTKLGHAREREDAIAELVQVGGAAIPYLAPRIEGTTGEMREGVLEALRGIAASCGLAEELAAAEGPEAFWAAYWVDYGSDYSAARARRLARRLVLRDDALARAELLRLHSFSFAPLLEELRGDVTPTQAARLVSLLHEIRGTGPVFSASDDVSARAEALAAWEEWWRREGAGYEAFGRLRRITSVITETQYAKWLSRVVTLSFGVSQRDGRPILSKLAEKLPITLLLSLLSVALAYGLAIPLGIFSALKRGSAVDRVVTVGLFVLYSLPVFWTATLLIQHLCGVSGPELFPLGGIASDGADAWPWWRRGADAAHHLVLPVICLSYVSLAVLSRYQQVAMLEVLSQDYIRTARAKGLSGFRVIVIHAARNALLPVVTLLGLQLPYMISGAVIVERIFNIPGMGLETFEAIRSHDYNWIMAVVTLSAVLTMVGILLSDVVYAIIDPRVRLETRPEGSEP
jgi:peptide/nickel transport system permease protein